MERAEWKAFVDNQMTRQRFPGMQGVGFIERVPAEKLASHIASVRGEEGLANYTVWPENQKQEYYPIVLAEPVDARNLQALGFDESSEQVRNAAITRGIDSSQTTIIGKITLLTKNETDAQSGFLMMVPVYENGLPADTPDERRENIKGLVYSPFRINDLMGGITGRTVRDVTFTIHDGDSPEGQNLMFDLAAVAGTKGAKLDKSFEKTVIMEIGAGSGY